MTGFGQTLVQMFDFFIFRQQRRHLFHIDPLEKPMVYPQGMPDSLQHPLPVPRQLAQVGAIVGERFEHLEDLPDLLLKGESDILGKRIDNDSEARRRQIPDRDEIARNILVRSDLNLRYIDDRGSSRLST